MKNGLLPVVLTDTEVSELMRRAKEIEGYQITVDLEKRTVSDAHGFAATFEIGDFQRYCLMEGLDDIGLTLQHESKIAAYEAACWIRKLPSVFTERRASLLLPRL